MKASTATNEEGGFFSFSLPHLTTPTHTTVTLRHLRERFREHWGDGPVDDVPEAKADRVGFFSRTQAPPALDGLNAFLRGATLEVGAWDGRRIELGMGLGTVELKGDITCTDLEVDDLVTTTKSPSSTTASSSVLGLRAREFQISCTTGYKYDTGRWWKPGSHSGIMDLQLDSSFDTKVELSTNKAGDTFRQAPPAQARVLSCDSDTKLGIELQSDTWWLKALNAILKPLQILFGGAIRDILCETWERVGADWLEQLLEEIRKVLEPYLDGTFDLSNVDRTQPQRELDERLGEAWMVTGSMTGSQTGTAMALMDYTDGDRSLSFDDFASFLERFRDVFQEFCDFFKGFLPDHQPTDDRRRLIQTHPHRELFLSGILMTLLGGTASAILSMVFSAVIKAVTDVLVGVITDVLGTPDEILQLLLGYIMDIINGNDPTAPTNPPAGEEEEEDTEGERRTTTTDGDPWSVDFMNLFSTPKAVPLVTTDSMKFSVRKAALSGSPVQNFSLKPTGKQTLDAKCDLPEVDADLRVWFDFDPAVLESTAGKDNVPFKLSVPRRVMDFTLSMSLQDVGLDTSVLAAVPVGVGDGDGIDETRLADWLCTFFPELNLNFFGLELAELAQPVLIVSGLLGGGAVDELINSLLAQFANLYQSVINEVLTNFFGTTFAESIGEALQNLLEQAKSDFEVKVCNAS